MKNKILVSIVLAALALGVFFFLHKPNTKGVMSAQAGCKEEKIKLSNPHYAVLVECPVGTRRSGLMSGNGGEIYVKCLCE